MPTTLRDALFVPSGYASAEAASFLAQLDDQSARLRLDAEGLTPAELAWQPAPGMNTIGMLLAHNAIVEVLWSQVLAGEPVNTTPILGLDSRDGDGMPMPEGAAPPAHLEGKPLSYFLDLLDRARVFAKQKAMAVEDSALETMRRRTRRDGTEQEFNVRWVLYHMLEHYAGHYGQILLLRHEYRARRAGA